MTVKLFEVIGDPERAVDEIERLREVNTELVAALRSILLNMIATGPDECIVSTGNYRESPRHHHQGYIRPMANRCPRRHRQGHGRRAITNPVDRQDRSNSAKQVAN